MGAIMTNKTMAKERFEALSEDGKLEKIFHHAMISVQGAINNPSLWRPECKEFREYLRAMLSYLNNSKYMMAFPEECLLQSEECIEKWYERQQEIEHDRTEQKT